MFSSDTRKRRYLVSVLLKHPVFLLFFGFCQLFPGNAFSDISLLGAPGQYFQLTDRWTGKQINTKNRLANAEHSFLLENDPASHWVAEPVGVESWFRLKNRNTGQYLHIQNRNGVVSVGAVPAGYWSSHWRAVAVGDYFRLTNRWVPDDAMNVQQDNGALQHGVAPDGYWSAQWRSTPVNPGTTPGQANVIGQWSPVADWPLIAIHAALTVDGKVLTYGTDAAGQQTGQFIYDVWNPALGLGATSHATLPNNTSTDLFCSAQMLIPGSNQMLLTGGDSRGLNQGRMSTGVADVNIFSSTGDTITPQQGMNSARWYPTATTLPSGEILVQGGIDTVGTPAGTPEIYNPQSGQWRELPGAANNYDWWYPRSWVAPNGGIFGLAGGQMYELDPTGAGAIRGLGPVTGTNKYYTSTSVMFRPGRILQIGGGVAAATSYVENASAQVTEYNINGNNPQVAQRPGLTYPRLWANSTVLPTGDVVVTGGSAAANVLTGVATAAEIYHPGSNSWTVGAEAVEDRLYHSTALLLPDASVLVAGGGAPNAYTAQGRQVAGNLNAEIYYPPYYFDDANRKRNLATVATDRFRFTWNQKIMVSPESASEVAQVNLVRVGSVTHSNNMEQRFIPLSFTRNGATQLSVDTPVNANIAPPGYYMLFVVDNNGVPSQGKIVSLVNSVAQDGGQDYFQITDRWLGRELYAQQNNGQLLHADIGQTQQTSHWSKEYLPGQTTWFQIKNRSTNEIIHIQPNNGSVALGNVPIGYWSAHWQEEFVDGYLRLVNRWQQGHRIHVQAISGVAQHGIVPDGYWSAQWQLSPVR